MAIQDGYKKNFTTMLLAADQGDLALVECTDKRTGKPVITVCAVASDGEGGVQLVPFAKMFDGNPFEELNPPEVSEDEQRQESP